MFHRQLHSGVTYAYSEKTLSSFNPILENFDIERPIAHRAGGAGTGAAAFS
jgi:hypothetical protein